MIVNLAGDVGDQMVDDLVKACNSLKPDEDLHIYLSTNGGDTGSCEAILDIINYAKDKITMYFYGPVFSAGMHILLKVDCKKVVLPDTIGMYHFGWQEISIQEGGKPSGVYEAFAMKEMKQSKNRTIAFLKTTKLTDKEINAIKAGKDVFFTHDRLQELI